MRVHGSSQIPFRCKGVHVWESCAVKSFSSSLLSSPKIKLCEETLPVNLFRLGNVRKAAERCIRKRKCVRRWESTLHLFATRKLKNAAKGNSKFCFKPLNQTSGLTCLFLEYFFRLSSVVYRSGTPLVISHQSIIQGQLCLAFSWSTKVHLVLPPWK